MRTENLYNGITQVADDLVDRAAEPCLPVRKKGSWISAVAAVAACAVLILTMPRFLHSGGSTDRAEPGFDTPSTSAPGNAAPGAPPAMDTPAEPDTPAADEIYTFDGAEMGLEERYWPAMENCVAIWHDETGFSQKVLEGVTVSVLSDAMRSGIILADGSEIDSGNWDFYIDVISELDPDVEYWDFAFPNGVHAIMDSRSGQMVGYILP